ncbi:hypothetical protein DFP73DRAFT_207320 [Morchella snyderi]|nr:hypothetical protein DFP73DRAFT_207320 [Morchella snyderi]
MGPDTASSRRGYLSLFVSLIFNPGMCYLLVRLVGCLGTEYFVDSLLAFYRSYHWPWRLIRFFFTGRLLFIVGSYFFFFLFRWVDAVAVNCWVPWLMPSSGELYPYFLFFFCMMFRSS